MTVLTVDELAAELRIGRRQAYDLANSGAIRVVRVGRSIRVPRAALAEFLGDTTERTSAQDGPPSRHRPVRRAIPGRPPVTETRGKAWRDGPVVTERPRCTGWAKTKDRRCLVVPLPTFTTCGLHTPMGEIRARLSELSGAAL